VNNVFHPESYIFIDESSFSEKDLNRKFGWSAKGVRAKGQKQRFSRTRYNLVMAHDSNSIICYRIYTGWTLSATAHSIWISCGD